ncbi:N-formylglutamate deformylase [Aurantiacibacter sp. D1-12]|uniref:N-formylglutamate deformylase n=1 Tax=Aurantiacibacter sp. D1-12 TaxID=2993658 RepID=UPI00237D2ECE|nr:N-formylglutamate deformylase [Aurantiacibacter sp. D1-12]MDE1467761.1 N-formylglutamate deformylase [Aurantiacibacter sp. D1-12]
MEPVYVTEGTSPLILAQPHSGTLLPDDVLAALNQEGRKLLDTDWRIPELYEGLVPEASVVRANFSRYVIDANRPPDGASLYPGQNTTGLVPLTTFDDRPIWLNAPDDAEIERRRVAFHQPYHATLLAEIERVRVQHGFAVLYDCHSIRSNIPYLFEGTLPDLNIGTNSGTSCAVAIERGVADACSASPFTSVLNGRFKGGWTTRHYGQPEQGVHAVQMEIAQSAYLETEAPPFVLSPTRSAELRTTLSRVFDAIQQTFGDLA